MGAINNTISDSNNGITWMYFTDGLGVLRKVDFTEPELMRGYGEAKHFAVWRNVHFELYTRYF